MKKAIVGLALLAALYSSATLADVVTSGQSPQQRALLSAYFTNATTTFSNTPVTFNVTAGRRYSFIAALYVSDSTAADGAKIDFNGGTATISNFRSHCVLNDTTTLLVGSAQSTALSTALTAALLTGAGVWVCTGTVELSVSGTFIVRAAQNSHTTGTLTVARGSWAAIEDVP